MFEKINADMVQAMKEKNKFNLSVLRMLKSALQLEKINKKGDLEDNDVIAVIKKQVKMRNDSITEFKKFDRTEEIDNLEREILVLIAYLPEELSAEAIDGKIDEAFQKINPTSMKDMGLIMKELQSIASQADMSVVSKKVKDKIMEL